MFTSSEIDGMIELVALSFVHKYTRSAASAGTEDDWHTSPPTYGAADVDLPCNYLSEGIITLRDNSKTAVDTPTISVPNTDTLKVGDRVTNIKDSSDTIVIAGPLYVEVVAPAMGFGKVTNYIATLTGQAPTAW